MFGVTEKYQLAPLVSFQRTERPSPTLQYESFLNQYQSSVIALLSIAGVFRRSLGSCESRALGEHGKYGFHEVTFSTPSAGSITVIELSRRGAKQAILFAMGVFVQDARDARTELFYISCSRKKTLFGDKQNDVEGLLRGRVFLGFRQAVLLARLFQCDRQTCPLFLCWRERPNSGGRALAIASRKASRGTSVFAMRSNPTISS